jgi:hypothetical protein
VTLRNALRWRERLEHIIGFAQHGRVNSIARACAVAIFVCATAGALAAHWAPQTGDPTKQPPSPAVPTEIHDEGYVGSQACEGCHARNIETWKASYHRRMTQAATPDAVLAPFDGVTPVLDGTQWKLSRDGDRFFVQPFTPEGAARGGPMRVAITTGSHHYQVYWLDLHDADEMPQFPFVWHVAEKRWVPRRSMFLAPPGPGTGSETGRWPRTCIKCHTTNGTEKHASDDRPHVAQFGIACEACHGPGGAHVELQRKLEKIDVSERPTTPDVTIVNPSALSHERSSQVCGQCHAVQALTTPEARAKWEHEGFSFRPGQDLAQSRTVLRGKYEANTPEVRAFLDRNPGMLAETFWSDGEVRVSGREYNGLLDSPCYQRGEMSCLSCHDLHPTREAAPDLAAWANDQLRPGMDGSQACVQCHAQYADAAKVTAHTHHSATSSGSSCMNCHMPYTAFGLTKAIRSHTITSPSIAASVATGRPDACNQCHLDRTLAWAADRMHEWYGQSVPELDADQRTIAASVVWALEGDESQRALMAWSYGWDPARQTSGTGWMPYVLSTLMQDGYDAVRFIATRSARSDPRYAKLVVEFTQPLEKQRDQVRATILADWMREGLKAPADRRDALLVRPDGTLDEARFRRLFAARNTKDISVGE